MSGFSAAYVNDDKRIAKRKYSVFLREKNERRVSFDHEDDLTQALEKITNSDFVYISGTDTKPILRPEAGEKKPLSDRELVVSEKLVLKIKDLQTSGNNYKAVRALMTEGFDVAMVDKKNKLIKIAYGFRSGYAQLGDDEYEGIEISAEEEGRDAADQFDIIDFNS